MNTMLDRRDALGVASSALANLFSTVTGVTDSTVLHDCLAILDPYVPSSENDYWRSVARPEQIAPSGDWRIWLIMAGRAFGKTRTGAEWFREQIMSGHYFRGALVGPTVADVRDVMIEGESGLLACCERYNFGAIYTPNRRRIDFENGAVAFTYSAETPRRFRGPQHDLLWGDEPGAWEYPETFDMAQFGMRLGDEPRQCYTGTPYPMKIIIDLVQRFERNDPYVVITGGSLLDNAENLPESFVEEVLARYQGTRIGRQEIGGELLLDIPGALWNRAMIDQSRIAIENLPPEYKRSVIVVGVDPPAGEGGGDADDESAICGIVAACIDDNGHGYILEDASIAGPPHTWASQVVAVSRYWRADYVVAEVNNGGAMVAHTINTVEPRLPVKSVHASRGKMTRAEPISALSEQGRISIVGEQRLLEDQMVKYAGHGKSPDRLDAMVWAMTALMVGLAPQTIDSATRRAFADMPRVA